MEPLTNPRGLLCTLALAALLRITAVYLGRDVKMKNLLRLLVIASPALLAASCNKTQYTAYGLAGNSIIEFDTKDPTKVSNTLTLSLTSLNSGDGVVSIFFRPGTGDLYCRTREQDLCKIDLGTGDVSLVQSATLFDATNFAGDLASGKISFVVTGFDPVNDRVRVFATDSAPNDYKNDDLNFSVDPESLAPDAVGGDIGLIYAGGDANDGKYPILVSIAYSSPFSGATSTTLYGIDSATQSLVRIGDQDATASSTSVHDGQVHTIAQLNVTDTSDMALAIEAKNGDAFVALGSTLYSIDLGSGDLSQIGTISDGSSNVTSLAFDPAE